MADRAPSTMRLRPYYPFCPYLSQKPYELTMHLSAEAGDACIRAPVTVNGLFESLAKTCIPPNSQWMTIPHEVFGSRNGVVLPCGFTDHFNV